MANERDKGKGEQWRQEARGKGEGKASIAGEIDKASWWHSKQHHVLHQHTHRIETHMTQGRFMLKSGICRSYGSFLRPMHILPLHLPGGLKFNPPGSIHHCINLDLLLEHL